jgi:DNA-directed RNA polymerase specialized sigma subunit
MKGAIREQIIRALKDEISQKEIVGTFKISQQYISKIKKQAEFDGEL